MKLPKYRAWGVEYKYNTVRMRYSRDYCSNSISVFFNLAVEGPAFGQDYAQVLMQWTGQTDKDGVEIYEGDIVATFDGSLEESERLEIKWCGEEGYPAFDVSPNHMDDCNGLSFHAQNVEDFSLKVIGNIYENPELLK